jgi:hypothetical protein
MQDKKVPTQKRILSSRVCKSRENRFSIFPIGVTSKNKLIGADITFSINLLWTLFEAFKVPHTSIILLKNAKMELRTARPRIVRL